jgi:hypothetical protein
MEPRRRRQVLPVRGQAQFLGHDRAEGEMMLKHRRDRLHGQSLQPRPQVNDPSKGDVMDDDMYDLAREVDRRYRRREFLALYGTWMTIAVLILIGVWLTGCSTVPDPGTRIGPYDISLTSHREALQ